MSGFGIESKTLKGGEVGMRYRFYHELLYQIADRLANYHIKWSLRCIGIMNKMIDRLKASIGGEVE